MQYPKGFKITSKLVRNLSVKEVTDCKRLRFRQNSGLLDEFTECLNRGSVGSFVVMVRDKLGRLRSWGLYSTLCKVPVGMFFTQRRYRRKGLGAAVYAAMSRRAAVVFRVIGHDNTSYNFFKAQKAYEIEYG